MAAKKIAVAAIEQLQRALEDVPECQVEDVSKVQAIRMLIPQIQKMRSKGYGWSAIAQLVSEGGIAVSAVTLKSYLTQAKAVGRKNGERKVKAPRRSQGTGRGAGTEPLRSTVGPAEGANRNVSADPVGASKTVSATASQQVAAPIPTALAKTGARRGEDGHPRRSSFVPKEDSEEI
jgi:hypothetical protein